MMKPVCPCWNKGEDCQNRAIACRASCEAWKEYERQQKEYRKERERQMAEESDLIVATSRRRKMRDEHLAKKTRGGR